jgi:hypothetical protein
MLCLLCPISRAFQQSSHGTIHQSSCLFFSLKPGTRVPPPPIENHYPCHRSIRNIRYPPIYSSPLYPDLQLLKTSYTSQNDEHRPIPCCSPPTRSTAPVGLGRKANIRLERCLLRQRSQARDAEGCRHFGQGCVGYARSQGTNRHHWSVGVSRFSDDIADACRAKLWRT